MNKRISAALLAVVALVQLILPLSFMANEKITMNAVIEKGTEYTLDYTSIESFTPKVMSFNTASIYTVGYSLGRTEFEDGFIPYNSLSVHSKVGITQNEKGELEFFDAQKYDKSLLKRDNWFNTYKAFDATLNSYDVVTEDFGYKELFDLSLLLGATDYNNNTFESFMEKGSDGLYYLPVKGKIVIKVYKGFAAISEVYIGEDLFLRHK